MIASTVADNVSTGLAPLAANPSRKSAPFASASPDDCERLHLLVEIHVTHPAEEAKLEELRLRELPAIEIDLSRAPRHAPREHHADLSLPSAVCNARHAATWLTRVPSDPVVTGILPDWGDVPVAESL